MGRKLSYLTVVLALVPLAHSLPPFQNLFEAKTGYKANCAVCHRPEDNRLTPYAREYRRQGFGMNALRTMDVMDPDRDGALSREEIAARSNPGDPRSTPGHPGSWLVDIRPVEPPWALLQQAYGRPVHAEAVQARLEPEQAKRIETALQEKLRDEEGFPTVYRVYESSGSLAPVGRAVYAYSDNKSPSLWKEKQGGGGNELDVFLVALGTGPALTALRPVKLHGDRRFAHDSYLGQFPGKRAETLLAVNAPRGAEAENQEVLRAVRRALSVLESVSR
jgi:hypothetical protein